MSNLIEGWHPLELWAYDLLHTDRPQTRGFLTRIFQHDERPVGDCCLGRACKVAIAYGLDLEVSELHEYERKQIDLLGYGSDREASHLPHQVRDWLGVDEFDPILVDEYDLQASNPDLTCTSANDIRKMTFAEIGELVRDHLIPSVLGRPCRDLDAAPPPPVIVEGVL